MGKTDHLEVKLGDGNWSTWNQAFRAILAKEELIGHGILCSDPILIKAGCDLKVLQELTFAVGTQYYPLLRKAGTRSQALADLQSLHVTKTKARLMELRLELRELKKNPKEIIQAWIARAQDISYAIIDVGDSLRDTELVEYVLLGLPDTYATAVEVLTQTMTDTTSLTDVEATLMRAERKHKLDRDKDVAAKAYLASNLAEGHQQQKSQQKSNKGGKKEAFAKKGEGETREGETREVLLLRQSGAFGKRLSPEEG